MSETPSNTKKVFKFVFLPLPLVTLYNFRILIFHLLPEVVVTNVKSEAAISKIPMHLQSGKSLV